MCWRAERKPGNRQACFGGLLRAPSICSHNLLETGNYKPQSKLPLVQSRSGRPKVKELLISKKPANLILTQLPPDTNEVI